jgi:hypothetical protein
MKLGSYGRFIDLPEVNLRLFSRPVEIFQCIWMPPAALPLPARAGGLHKPQT